LVKPADPVARPVYSPLVIEHFEHPLNVGRLAPAEDVIEASAGRKEQGTVFCLSAKVSGDSLAAIGVQTYGCPHCIAAGSWLSERLIGAKLTQLLEWSWREAEKALEVPPEKRGRLLLLEDVVRQLAVRWQERS
jgi:NifU-like protein involved in Fe-S cluster formation